MFFWTAESPKALQRGLEKAHSLMDLIVLRSEFVAPTSCSFIVIFVIFFMLACGVSWNARLHSALLL